MRKLIILILALTIAFTGCTASTTAQDKDIVVLYTTDVHGAAVENIGYAGLSAYKAQLENEGNYLALVDAGDAIAGAPIATLSEGEDIVDLMNQVGYDFAVPGNHEFDYGMEQFLTLAKKANYEYLSANLYDLKANEPICNPYGIKDFGGTKVAFVGVTTPSTSYVTRPTNFMNAAGDLIYGFKQGEDGTDFYVSVQGAVDRAKKEGAHYVVAVAHLGQERAASPYTATELIANTSGIDVVLDGHSHLEIECQRIKNKDGAYVLLSQAATNLASIGMLLISKEGNISTGLVKEYTKKDAKTESLIQELNGKFEAKLAQVVAKSQVDLVTDDPVTNARMVRNKETNIGDLCADAYRMAAEADLGIINGGGIRASLRKGDITYGDTLLVQPYSNYLCLIEATGQEILEALEMGARVAPKETGGFLQVSGGTYEIHTATKSSVILDENGMFASVGGEYRVKNVTIAGAPLALSKTYTVAGIDYMLKSGGDGYSMFSDNVIRKDMIMLDHQALLVYMTKTLGGVIGSEYADPYGSGRITLVKE